MDDVRSTIQRLTYSIQPQFIKSRCFYGLTNARMWGAVVKLAEVIHEEFASRATGSSCCLCQD